MSRINITVGEFNCGDPSNPYALDINIGSTYRNGDTYLLNYTTNFNMYDSLAGITTDVFLFYATPGNPYTQYTGSILPNNATNFSVTLPPADEFNLQLRFEVNGGSACFQYITIPYGEIIIAP